MRSLAVTFFRFYLLFAVTVALVAVGFAHRTAQPPLSPELAAYVAIGGAIDDICGAVDGEENATIVDCEACRLTDATSLPHRFCIALTKRNHKTVVLGFVARKIADSRGLDPARLVRAPPQV